MKIVHVSDIHIHDQQANLSAIAEGIKGLMQPGKPAGTGLGFLRKGIHAISMVKRLGYTVSEDRPELRKILLDQVEREEPDHIIVSGDITNTALRSECEEARKYFERFLNGGRLSIVPGNHDFPVFMEGTAKVIDYFTEVFPGRQPTFPYMKLIGKRLAIIGLNSCLEIFHFISNPEVLVHTARGKLDPEQLKALSEMLRDPVLEGRYKIVFLHHHVLSFRKKTAGRFHKAQNYFMEKAVNADYLLQLLQSHGVSMVLHGHRHVRNIVPVNGMIVIGAGSAVHPDPFQHPPSYHVYEWDDETPRITIKALDRDHYRTLNDSAFIPDPGQLARWQYRLDGQEK